jgi:GT2 family glycosyltransferase
MDGVPHWSIAARRITMREIDRAADGFRATGHDPRIVIDLARPLPPGWYLVELVLAAEIDTVSRAFLDFGHGISESTGTVLRTTGDGVRRIVLRAPKRFRRLRIDPCEAPVDFHIRDIRLVALTADSAVGPRAQLESGIEILTDPSVAVVPKAPPRRAPGGSLPTVPGDVVTAVDCEVVGSAVRVTGPKPMLAVRLAKPLRRGWYELVVRTESDNGAKLKASFGFVAGVYNWTKVPLDRGVDGLHSTWVFLPRRVARLRLWAEGPVDGLIVSRIETNGAGKPWGAVHRRRTRSGILVVDQAAQQAARRPPWTVPAVVEAANDIEPAGGGFRAVSYDAFFLLRMTEPLPRGWYRIEARIKTDPMVRPRVRLDFGEGFEGLPIRLARDHPPVFSAFCKLPRPLKAIRFEPCDHPTGFVVDTFVLRRISFSKVARRAVASAVRHMRSDPVRFRRFLRDAAMSLLQPKKIENFSSASSLYWGSGNRDYRYSLWQATFDFDEHRHAEDVGRRAAALAERPLFSLLMPLVAARPEAVAAAIAAVRRQIWTGWELVVAIDRGVDPAVAELCDVAAADDKRVHVWRIAAGAGLSVAANTALAHARGSHIAVIGAGDHLRPHALAELAIALAEAPGTEILYADEDTLNEDGGRCDPHFKPDWSEDLFHAWNYLGRPVVLRTATAREAGGFRRAVEAAQEYDLILRILEHIAPSTIRHLPKVVCHRFVGHRPEAPDTTAGEAFAAGKRALEEHLERRRLAATVLPVAEFPSYRVRRPVPDPAPAITLIVPTRDRPDLLRPFLHTLFGTTDYPALRLTLIDNGTVDPEALSLIATFGERPEVTVIRDEAPFNYSRLNNRAVALADTPLVALVNNDIRIVEPGWLSELVSHAVRPEVGCVGAKLFYPDGRIQHAGVGLGIGGVAGHVHHLFPEDSTGYFGRLSTPQDFSAVTGAVMAMRKAVFEEVGGLDERNLTVAYNDIDLCLKIRRAGYRIVWTPFARLVHYESASRGQDMAPEKRRRYEREMAYMRAAWGRTLMSDPYYSANFDLTRPDFMPAT